MDTADIIYPTQAILDGGVEWINFFNGRLLTGDDLTQEQDANQKARQLLGQAMGEGVASGLWVAAPVLGDNSDTGLVVNVDSGLAINRQGQAMRLNNPQTVYIGDTAAPASTSASRPSKFQPCSQPTQSATGSKEGLYLLTLCPGLGSSGRAPVSGSGAAIPVCNSAYQVEGVQFNLTKLLTPPADPKLVRNALAYDCFDLGDLQDAASTPFTLPSDSGYGRLDSLRITKQLKDSEVPLAVIYRDAKGINFVDNWSVRRRIAPPPANDPWRMWTSGRRTSEREAAFFQFQEQLADLLLHEPSVLAGLKASDRFGYLPPVGIIPVGSGYLDWHSFLGAHGPNQEIQVDQGLLEDILLEAMQCQPFRVQSRPYAALEVYRLSDPSNFVLFARTRLSRLRVNLTNPPIDPKAVNLTTSSANSNLIYKGYQLTADAQNSYQTNNLPAGDYVIGGSIDGYKPLPTGAAVKATLIGGQVTEKPLSLQPLPPGLISVNVYGLQRTLLTKEVTSVTAQLSGKIIGYGELKNKAWLVSNLPVGTYDVVAEAEGYRSGTQSGVDVASEKTTDINLRLTPDVPLCLDFEKIIEIEKTPVQVRMCLLLGWLDQVDNAALQVEIASEFVQIKELTAVQKRIEEWVSWFATNGQTRSSMEIAKQNTERGALPVSLYMRKDYQPIKAIGEAPKMPQAYLVIDKIYLPLTVISPVKLAQPPLPLAKFESLQRLPTAKEIQAAFESYGIYYIDQIAGLWLTFYSDAQDLQDVLKNPKLFEDLIGMAIGTVLERK